MKIKYFILRDSADEQFDDLIEFDDYVNKEDIIKAIERVKKNEDYTNEDVYEELRKIGSYTLQWIGQYDIFMY